MVDPSMARLRVRMRVLQSRAHAGFAGICDCAGAVPVFRWLVGDGMLRLSLFGAPYIEQNGQVVRLRRSKALALLAYLATTRQPHDRDALLALLWPEFD